MTWLIIGAGVSGLGAAKLLRHQGHKVRLSEKKSLADEDAQPFRDLGCDVRDGGHDLSHLEDVISIVPSPGLPRGIPVVATALERKIPQISEIDLALEAFRGQVIGVTGTNGKSTVCAMIGHILKNLGSSATVGGNFGDPPTAQIAEGRIGDTLVLELSSYQLEQSQPVRTVASIFTSFSSDHLGFHGDLRSYFAAKWKLMTSLEGNGRAILPVGILREAEKFELASLSSEDLWWHTSADHFNEESGENSKNTWATGTGFRTSRNALESQNGRLKLDLTPLKLSAKHDLLNSSLAMLAAWKVRETSPKIMVEAAAGFGGLPHRMQLIGLLVTPNGHRQKVFNDSKATNLESVICALEAQTSPVLLWLGGRAKSATATKTHRLQGSEDSFGVLKRFTDRIAAVVCFGEASELILHQLDHFISKDHLHSYDTLAAACADAPLLQRTYHQVNWLFSPGGSSFDEFKDFADRGNFFRDSMGNLSGFQGVHES